jgi:Fe-S-cluster-containing hydrogenase component 2
VEVDVRQKGCHLCRLCHRLDPVGAVSLEEPAGVDQPWLFLGYAATERSRRSRWREQGQDKVSSRCTLAGYASGASATGKDVSLVCITLGFL